MSFQEIDKFSLYVIKSALYFQHAGAMSSAVEMENVSLRVKSVTEGLTALMELMKLIVVS